MHQLIQLIQSSSIIASLVGFNLLAYSALSLPANAAGDPSNFRPDSVDIESP